MQECLERGLPSEEIHYPALTKAFERISHGLRNTQKAFPTNSMVKEALVSVNILTPRGRGRVLTSRWEKHLAKSKLAETFSGDSQGFFLADDDVKEYASKLSTEQCTMAIEIFNRYEDQLSEEVIEALKPILLVVLKAVVVGCFQVAIYYDKRRYQYFEDVQLVKELKGLEIKRPIYLRDWMIRDEE